MIFFRICRILYKLYFYTKGTYVFLNFPDGSLSTLSGKVPLDTNSNASGSNPRAAIDDWDIDEQEFALDETDSLDALGSDSSDEDPIDQDQNNQDGPSENPGCEVPSYDTSADLNSPSNKTAQQDHSSLLAADSMPSTSAVSATLRDQSAESIPSEDKVDCLKVPSASDAENLQQSFENMPKNAVKNARKAAVKKVSFDTTVKVMDFQGSSSMVDFDCEGLSPSPAYDSTPAASSDDWDLDDEEFAINKADSLDAMKYDSSDEDYSDVEEDSQEIPSHKLRPKHLVHGMSDDSEDTLNASSNQVDRLSTTPEMVDIQPLASTSMVNNEDHPAQNSVLSVESTDEWDIEDEEFAVDGTNSLDAIEDDSSDEDILVEDHVSCDTQKDAIPKPKEDLFFPKATTSAEGPSAGSLSLPSAFAPKVNKYIKTEAPSATGATHTHSKASPWQKDPSLSSSMVNEEVHMDLPCSINTMPGTSTSGLPVQMDSNSSSPTDLEQAVLPPNESSVSSSSTSNENSTSKTILKRVESPKTLTKTVSISKALNELDTGRATPMVDFNTVQEDIERPASPTFKLTSYTTARNGRLASSSNVLKPSSKKSLTKRKHKSKPSGFQRNLLRYALLKSAAVRRSTQNNGSWQESLTDREKQEFREMTRKIVRAAIFSDLSGRRHDTESWTEKLKWYVKLGMRFGARHPDPDKRKTLFTYLSHKMENYYTYYFGR